MSRNSYSASERRGVLAIAVIALLIIAAGLGLTFCNRTPNSGFSDSGVIEDTSMVDSVTMEQLRNSSSKKKGTKKTKEKSKTTKTNKTYRRRSPLDEPV